MAILAQLTLDQITILEVDSDPTLSGVTAPIGSTAYLYDGTNAKSWLKTSGVDTGWTLVPTLVPGSVLQGNAILFTDATGQIKTNTTNLIWDPTNARLGIGSAAPATPVNTIHLDRGTGQGSGIKFTAGSTTGQTSGDGFSLGIDAAGIAYVNQFENSQLILQTNNTRLMTLTPAGQVLIGTSASAIDITGLSVFPLLEIIGTSAVQMAQIQYSADTIAPVFNSLKSRGASIGIQGLVLQDDELGRFQFRGSDGVNFQAGASIRALVDGTAAAGSMPGRLIFMTTPSGATGPVERMRISQNGLVKVVDNFQSFRRVWDFQTAATANTTTTLTASSAGVQIFTGSTAGQIVKLPDATTLVVGQVYEIRNTATVTVALQNNAGTALETIPATNGIAYAMLLTNGTAAGTWSTRVSFEPFAQSAQSSTTFTTASATDVAVTTMSITPPAGTYMVIATGYTSNSANGNVNTYSLYSGGTQIPSTEVAIGETAGVTSAMATNALATVNGSQAIELRARRSAGTLSLFQRTMVVTRVG